MGVEHMLPLISVILGFILTLFILKLVVIVTQFERNEQERFEDSERQREISQLKLDKKELDLQDKLSLDLALERHLEQEKIDEENEVVVLFSIAFFLVIAFTVVSIF